MALSLRDLIDSLSKKWKEVKTEFPPGRQEPLISPLAPTPTPDPFLAMGYEKTGERSYRVPGIVRLGESRKQATFDVSPTPTVASAPTAMPTPTRRPAPTTIPSDVRGAKIPTQTLTPTPFITESSPKFQSGYANTPVTFRTPAVQRAVVERAQNVPEYRIAFDAIKNAANEFGIPEDLMIDIAFAESSLYYGKEGKTQDVGLFQFTPNTWTETMDGLGLPANTDRKDAVANARGAAWQIRRGYLGKWDNSKWRKNKEGVETGWGQYYMGKELMPFDYRLRQ